MDLADNRESATPVVGTVPLCMVGPCLGHMILGRCVSYKPVELEDVLLQEALTRIRHGGALAAALASF